MSDAMTDFLIRLENKVDALAEAVKKLVIVEERQTAQSERIARLEARLEKAEEEQRKGDKRIDRLWYTSVGAIGVVSVLLEVARAIWGH